MNRICNTVLLLTVVLCPAIVGSCIREDRKECDLDISFSYTYNVKEADAFSSEVRSIDLYIFDQNGSFIAKRVLQKEVFGPGYAFKTESLAKGQYSFVAFCRSRALESGDRDFQFCPMVQGVSNIKDLYARLDRNGTVCDTDFASFFIGRKDVFLESGRQKVSIPLVKMSNRFRIIFLPYNENDVLDEKEVDIRIEGNAGTLDSRGEKYIDDPLTFMPYSLSLSKDPTKGGEVNNVIIADLKTSRLIYDDTPQLVLSISGTEVLKLNLSWFLTLQGIAEHRSSWSDQEYLDRQDCFNISFFIDKGKLIRSRIIVNGWVVSLEDVSL